MPTAPSMGMTLPLPSISLNSAPTTTSSSGIHQILVSGIGVQSRGGVDGLMLDVEGYLFQELDAEGSLSLK